MWWRDLRGNRDRPLWSVGSREPSDDAKRLEGQLVMGNTSKVQEHHYNMSSRFQAKGHAWGVTKPLEAPAFKGVLSEPEVAVQDFLQLVRAGGGSFALRNGEAGDLLPAPVLQSSSGCSAGSRGVIGPLPVSALLCSSGGSPLPALADDSAPWASPQQDPAERRRAGAGA